MLLKITLAQQLGYLIISLNQHKEFFIDLTDTELLELKRIAGEMQALLNKSFSPDWYNYQQNGNMVKHLHFHLIHRYQHEVHFGSRVFVDNNYGRPLENLWIPESEDFLSQLAHFLREQIDLTVSS